MVAGKSGRWISEVSDNNNVLPQGHRVTPAIKRQTARSTSGTRTKRKQIQTHETPITARNLMSRYRNHTGDISTSLPVSTRQTSSPCPLPAHPDLLHSGRGDADREDDGGREAGCAA
jgi:hypothetical protein